MKKQNIVYLGLSGASGRMGKAVKQLIREKKSGVLLSATLPPASNLKFWTSKTIDGVIDFSSPELFEKVLLWCIKNRKPFVSGTTALASKQKQKLKKASQKIPVFYEENMSWGIWLLRNWIKSFSDLKTVDIVLEDIHHKNKKDKPSGTALKLKAGFSKSVQRKLKILSLRKGHEFGTHRIWFKAPEETVLLEHRALNRKLFARGALNALKWLINQKPGFYGSGDLYGKANP